MPTTAVAPVDERHPIFNEPLRGGNTPVASATARQGLIILSTFRNARRGFHHLRSGIFRAVRRKTPPASSREADDDERRATRGARRPRHHRRASAAPTDLLHGKAKMSVSPTCSAREVALEVRHGIRAAAWRKGGKGTTRPS